MSTGTYERVLDSACRIFSEKGYRDTTVAEICASAQANVAAVNYYFASKQSLYLAAWQRISESVHKQYFDQVKAISDPVLRLREMVFQRVRHAFDDGPPGRFRRMIHAEMGDPTEVHETIMERFLLPLADLLTSTIAEIVDLSPSDPSVRRCAFSLQSQLVSIGRLRMKVDLLPLVRLMGTSTPTTEQIDELAEHLVTFAMGGVRAATGRSARKEASRE